MDGRTLPTRIALLLVPAFWLGMAACGEPGDEPADGEPAAAESAGERETCEEAAEIDPGELEPADSEPVTRDLRPGEGEEAEAGDELVVHYTGCLLDGTRFDSSRDRGQPFVFALGEGAVIAGWDEGLPGLRVGGERRLIIPPEMAYGEAGSGEVIPPDAMLVFDVELLELR